MKNLSIFVFIILFIVNGCSTTCMEYRSATTAARSEKNLNRAEQWGLKALESPECNPETDAHAPYFLATEVYLKQNNYIKMAEMLSIAETRNKDQLLENPFRLEDQIITTISQGVEAYRDQEWIKVYNRAVDNIQTEKIKDAITNIDLATKIHPYKAENYSTMAAILLNDGDYDGALEIINNGIKINNSSSLLYQMLGGIYSEQKKLDLAEESLIKAIELSSDPGPIMRDLLFVYIDSGNNQQAIDYSNELLNKYPNDADIYYNVGVLYMRVARQKEESAKSKFNKLNEISNPEKTLVQECYNEFKDLRNYATLAKDYFYEASDLEGDEIADTQEAISGMKKAIKEVDSIYIDSIIQIARQAEIELD